MDLILFRFIKGGKQMKYILLDTNIVIDMVIDRRKQVSDTVLSNFIKLLDYNEIKLIVPEIVKVETYRHLEEELTLVGKQIKIAMKNIDDLYGITTYDTDSLDIHEYKKHSKQELTKAYEKYNKNEKEYKADLIKTIDMVFNHKSSVVIPYDDFLGNAVIKRRIYKRAPFHKEKKESYADALIAETLINLGRYITLEPSDEVFFVTGNYSDFCNGKEDKATLHRDIVDDIKAEGIPCKVNCINTFGELIGNNLKENIEAADLSDEFDAELRQQQEEYIEGLQDMIREGFNLTPMRGYPNKLETHLMNSDFATSILEKLNELNNIYNAFEDKDYNVIYEQLKYILESAHTSEITVILAKFKNVFGKLSSMPNIGTDSAEDFKYEDLRMVFEWISKQQELIDDILSIDKLPDNINYGDIIEIKDSKFRTLKFSLDELSLSPEAGSCEEIGMKLYTDSDKVLARGSVSVTYGNLEFDEEIGIQSTIQDDISYNYDHIIGVLQKIINEWRNLANQQDDIARNIINEFELSKENSSL